MRKRNLLASMVGAVLLSSAATMTVFAAGWTQQTNGQWCYLENDGSKATDVWRKSCLLYTSRCV